MSDSSAILAELNRRKATLSPEKQALVEELNKRAIRERAIRERPVAGNLARIPEEKPVPGLFSGEYRGPTGTVAPGEPLLGKAARRVLGLTPLGPAINRLIPEEKGDRLTGALERQAIGGVGSAIKGVASIPKAVYEEGPAMALLRPQIEQGKQAWRAGKEGRLSEMVGHGVAALTPMVGPLVASATERAETGTVGPAAELATLAGAPKPVMRAAEQFLSVGKRIGEVTFARPGTVEYNWGKGALELLKRARQEKYQEVSKAYPKIEPRFNQAELDQILPPRPAREPKTRPVRDRRLPGIRAAREKLETAGPTETGIRNARAELWTYRKRLGLPTDEFKAYGDAYGQLTAQLRSQYANAGKLPDFLEAEKGFAKFMETFHNPDSPVFKALDAELPASGFVEPTTVFNKLGTTVAGKQIESLGDLGMKWGERFRMRQVGKFSDPAFSSGIAFTLKIPLIRQALGYLLTRPIGIKALEKPAIQPSLRPRLEPFQGPR